MRSMVFRCRCGAAVRSGLAAPPSHPRAVPRRPVLLVELRCTACGTVAEYASGDALVAAT